jgi:hypothetical protein
MIPPIILPDSILDLSRRWCEEYRKWRRKPDHVIGEFYQIAEEQIVSPEDNKPRLVRLWLCGSIPDRPRAKAATEPKDYSEDGQVRSVMQGVYTILLDHNKLDSGFDPVAPAILHELIHTIDPHFDRDWETRSQNQPAVRTSVSDYRFASEQRAFSAMWTDDFRTAIEHRRCGDPEEMARRFCRCFSFSEFWNSGGMYIPHLRQQTLDHFAAIIADLKKRAGIASNQTPGECSGNPKP